MIRSLLACVLLAPLLPPAADGPVGPRGAPLEQDPQRVITWRGCGISKKAFMAHAAEVYEQRTGVRVELSGGGAALGIQAAGEGAADFGGTSIDTTIYEEGGDCWMNAQSAESCTVACENAVDDIVTVTEDTEEGVPPACE